MYHVHYSMLQVGECFMDGCDCQSLNPQPKHEALTHILCNEPDCECHKYFTTLRPKEEWK